MQVETLRTAEEAVRWVARIVAVIIVLINGFALLSIVGEGQGQTPPLFAWFITALALSLVGALLAFRWARPGAIVLIAAGLGQLLLWRLGLSQAWGHAFAFVVPSIALGAVLLVLSGRLRVRRNTLNA